jgi:predicted transcriptional regulator
MTTTKKYYRTKIEILVQFLQAANAHDGISITHLMYVTFVPHRQVKEYLNILVRNGLLEYERAARTYKTTQKGLKFLQVYEKLLKLANTTATTSDTEMKLVRMNSTA